MTKAKKGKVPADLAAPKHCDRDRVKTWVCGWCSNAANSVNVRDNHRRCPGHPCACGALDHKFDRAIADVMVKVTRLDLDTIYAAHGRTRRVLSPEHAAKLQAGRRAYDNALGSVRLEGIEPTDAAKAAAKEATSCE